MFYDFRGSSTIACLFDCELFKIAYEAPTVQLRRADRPAVGRDERGTRQAAIHEPLAGA